MKFNREWSFPNPDTFKIPPIGAFVQYYLRDSKVSVDPFARNFNGCTYTNDLNKKTLAQYHLPATDFLKLMKKQGVSADLVIFDPPYSVTQLKECYENIGLEFTQKDAQSLAYKQELLIVDDILSVNGIVLTFGWSSTGMSKRMGYAIEEILLVSHGRRQHDTICMAERKVSEQTKLWSN